MEMRIGSGRTLLNISRDFTRYHVGRRHRIDGKLSLRWDYDFSRQHHLSEYSLEPVQFIPHHYLKSFEYPQFVCHNSSRNRIPDPWYNSYFPQRKHFLCATPAFSIQHLAQRTKNKNANQSSQIKIQQRITRVPYSHRLRRYLSARNSFKYQSSTARQLLSFNLRKYSYNASPLSLDSSKAYLRCSR